MNLGEPAKGNLPEEVSRALRLCLLHLPLLPRVCNTARARYRRGNGLWRGASNQQPCSLMWCNVLRECLPGGFPLQGGLCRLRLTFRLDGLFDLLFPNRQVGAGALYTRYVSSRTFLSTNSKMSGSGPFQPGQESAHILLWGVSARSLSGMWPLSSWALYASVSPPPVEFGQDAQGDDSVPHCGCGRMIRFACMKPGVWWIVTSEGFFANPELPGRKSVHIPAGARVIVLNTQNPDHVRFSRGGKNYWIRPHFEASCTLEDG